MSVHEWAKRPARLLGVAAMLVAALALAACGSSDSSSTSGSSTTSATGTTGGTSASTGVDADAVLAKAYKGEVKPPPATGPKAVKGKTVWISTCLAFEACKALADSAQQAAKGLGWNVRILDNKGDPNTLITQIKQAISAKADGLITTTFDCPTIKAGLQAAQQAKLPVINWGGLDCDYAKFGGKPLFAAPVRLFGTRDAAGFYSLQGTKDADFMLAQLAKQGVSDPKIIQTQEHDIALLGALSDAFSARIEEKCPSCTLSKVDFTLAQLASGKGSSLFRAGILAHPDADAIYYPYSAQLSLGGLANAIKTAPNKYKVVCCGDGLAGAVQLTNQEPGDVTATNVYPYQWYGWSLVDVMNRLFAGQAAAEVPDSGGVSVYLDKDHGLPAAPPAPLPFDYQAAYKKVWGID